MEYRCRGVRLSLAAELWQHCLIETFIVLLKINYAVIKENKEENSNKSDCAFFAQKVLTSQHVFRYFKFHGESGHLH